MGQVPQTEVEHELQAMSSKRVVFRFPFWHCDFPAISKHGSGRHFWSMNQRYSSNSRSGHLSTESSIRIHYQAGGHISLPIPPSQFIMKLIGDKLISVTYPSCTHNMMKYVENMKEYKEICGKFEGISPTI